jgi:hypothetical protein
MTRRRKIPVFAAALLAAGALAAAAKKPESKEPFFHQFLIPGDPLDDNLLAQEKRVRRTPSPRRCATTSATSSRNALPEGARAEYRKALELDKTFFLAAYNLGLMEETEGRVDAAISAYARRSTGGEASRRRTSAWAASTRSSGGPTTPSTSTRKRSDRQFAPRPESETRSSSTPA